MVCLGLEPGRQDGRLQSYGGINFIVLSRIAEILRPPAKKINLSRTLSFCEFCNYGFREKFLLFVKIYGKQFIDLQKLLGLFDYYTYKKIILSLPLFGLGIGLFPGRIIKDIWIVF